MIITFTLQSTTDGSLMTGKAGSTTVYLSKDFGTYAQATNSVVEVGRGEYKLTLTTAESTYTTELHYQPVCSGAVTNTYAVAKDIVFPADYAKETSITALQTHGDTSWKTATGFAVPGDEMTLTRSYDNAMTASQLTTADIPTVVQIQNGLATSSALATVDTVVDAIKAKTDTLVNTDTATLAKSAELVSLQTHGDSAWSTATGFAVPGSAMTLTADYNAAKTASQLTSADIPTVAQIQAGLSTFNASTDTVTIDSTQAATMVTATGFATPSNVTASQQSIISHGDTHWTGGSGSGLTAQQVWEYNGGRTVTNTIPTVVEIQSGLAKSSELTGLSTFDPTEDTVTINSEQASTMITATGFATPTNVTTAKDAIINRGNTAWTTAAIPNDYAKASDLAVVDTVVDSIKTKVDTLQNTDISSLATSIQANDIKSAVAMLNSGLFNWLVSGNTLTVYNANSTVAGTYTITRDSDGVITKIQPVNE